MKRLLMTIAFTCAVSSSALAGDIPSVGSPAPAPNPPKAAISPAPGEIPTSGVVDQLSSDALSALLTALSFLTV
jgi:hypothetical protein